MKLNIAVYFLKKATPYGDVSYRNRLLPNGVTLYAHEYQHVGALLGFLDEPAINAAIKTGGFGTECECMAALSRFNADLDAQIDLAVAASNQVDQ